MDFELEDTSNRELEAASAAIGLLTDADKMSEDCLRAIVFIVEDLMSPRRRAKNDRKVTRECCARLNNMLVATIDTFTKARLNLSTLAQLSKE